MPVCLHHYSSYTKSSLNISGGGGENTVRKSCLNGSAKASGLGEGGKLPFLRSYDVVLHVSNCLFCYRKRENESDSFVKMLLLNWTALLTDGRRCLCLEKNLGLV